MLIMKKRMMIYVEPIIENPKYIHMKILSKVEIRVDDRHLIVQNSITIQ
jgi:hypothetical protein